MLAERCASGTGQQGASVPRIRLRRSGRQSRISRRRSAPPEWLESLLSEVWAREGLSEETLPRLAVSPPARSTRGYINYGRVPFRIVVRVDDDEQMMRNTLLHEAAHAVHRTHAFQREKCTCDEACVWDGHGATYKRHLARLEHRFQAGTHSRWGVAGCRGLRRVPARTPWHSSIPCPRVPS